MLCRPGEGRVGGGDGRGDGEARLKRELGFPDLGCH